VPDALRPPIYDAPAASDIPPVPPHGTPGGARPPEPLARALPVHFGQGLLMGTADIIPGVSGGTMALIVGVYERLIEAIRLALSLPVTLLKGWGPARRQIGEVEWRLVIPLGVGILTAIVAASQVIPPLLEAYPAESRGLFFGLITASILIPWRRMERAGPREFALMGVMAVVAFVLTGLPALEAASDPGLLRVFLSASVAICAMILPGVSGAFLLLVLGIYEATLAAIGDRNLLYIGVFALGALVGLGLFSRLLSWLLEHRHDITMAALIGLMVGSLRALWPWLSEDGQILAPEPAPASAVVLALAVFGFTLVYGMTWLGAKRLGEAPRVG
jgi:putative membrane protein